MDKPWKIFISYADLSRAQIGAYSCRADAEVVSRKLRRSLPPTVAIYAVWSPDHD
jgi:hypothetical protein